MDLYLNGHRVLLPEIGGIDFKDYPDLTDAYFEYAEYEDETPLTDWELDQLTEENYEYILDHAIDKMYDAADHRRDCMRDEIC